MIDSFQKGQQNATLQTMLGKETWDKLNQEDIWTVWAVASLAPERLQQICHNWHLDQDILTRF